MGSTPILSQNNRRRLENSKYKRGLKPCRTGLLLVLLSIVVFFFPAGRGRKRPAPTRHEDGGDGDVEGSSAYPSDVSSPPGTNTSRKKTRHDTKQ